MPTHDRIVVAPGCCVYATRYVMTLRVVGMLLVAAAQRPPGGRGGTGPEPPHVLLRLDPQTIFYFFIFTLHFRQRLT